VSFTAGFLPFESGGLLRTEEVVRRIQDFNQPGDLDRERVVIECRANAVSR
jgi:hypothetical protein